MGPLPSCSHRSPSDDFAFRAGVVSCSTAMMSGEISTMWVNYPQCVLGRQVRENVLMFSSNTVGNCVVELH